MTRLGLVALLVTVTAGPTRAQEVSRENRERGHRMLQHMREQLDKYYYDSTYHGVDLDRGMATADSVIDAAGSLPEVMGALAQFLASLDDSHTRFDPPGLNVTVEYGWSEQAIGNDCYVTDVKAKSDADKQGLRVGDRILAIDGIRPTRDNLNLIEYVYYRLSPRPRVRLVVESEGGDTTQLPVDAEMKRQSNVVDVTDIELRRFLQEQWRVASGHPNHHTKTIADSVLVWRMHGFQVGNGRDGFDEAIDRHMEEARRHRYLVLDLRGNHGGAVVTLRRLLGHFFADTLQVGARHMRDTVDQLIAPPVGETPFSGEAIVLIDSESASAAEITARTLQLRNRATIVGDRSAGAVMTSIYLRLELGSIFQARVLPFGMSVTVTDLIMPDGTSLEKHGVIPNIAVLPTAKDLAEKRDPVLAFALELAGVKMSPEDAGKLFKER